MALLRCLLQMASSNDLGRVCVGHFNHGQRARESDADEQFVADLCQSLDLPVFIGRSEPKPGLDQAASESSLRSARYGFLKATALELGARYLVTGHTADDQVETVLHRVIRGTGLVGLAGIPRTRQLSTGLTLIRPQLAVRRAQILDYLQHVGQPYRLDASNCQTNYTRNAIRHDLLPLLRERFNPEVDSAVLRLGELAHGATEWLEDQVGPWLESHCRFDSGQNSVAIALPSVRNCSGFLVGQILLATWKRMDWPMQGMGHEQWTSIVGNGPGGRQVPSGEPARGHSRHPFGRVISHVPFGELTRHLTQQSSTAAAAPEWFTSNRQQVYS